MRRTVEKRILLLIVATLMLGCGFVSTAVAAEPQPPVPPLPPTPDSATLASGFVGVGHLGEPAEVTSELNLQGSAYHGNPSPIEGFTIDLPNDISVSDVGFPTCTQQTIERYGTETHNGAGCPAGSIDGPTSQSVMNVAFGAEYVEELVTVQAVFGPNHYLYFYTTGHYPVSVEFVMAGHYVLPITTHYALALAVEVPLVETVPGGADADFTKLVINYGASLEENGVALHSVNIPDECPSGKFSWGAEIDYFQVGNKLVPGIETTCPAAGPREATTTALAASNTTPVLGETVTYTATIKPVSKYVAEPYGSVTFLNGTTPIQGCSALPLGAAPGGATATCQNRSATYGEHSISAVYSGDPDYLGSTSAVVTVMISPETEEALHKKQHEEEVQRQQEEAAAKGAGTGGGGTPTGTTAGGTAATANAAGTIPAGGTTHPGSSKAPSGETPPLCRIPKLRGKTLAQAKTLLSKGHCKLGKVTKPKGHSKRKQVVVSQSPAGGQTEGNGGKISIKLS